MPASDKDVIRWQLKYLIEHRDELSENDLDWATKMEESYKRKGWLSPREMEILDNIYRRY